MRGQEDGANERVHDRGAKSSPPFLVGWNEDEWSGDMQ